MMQIFQQSPILSMFCESALFFPLFQSRRLFNSNAAAKTSKLQTGIAKLAKASIQILKILDDAYKYHMNFGSSHELHAVANDIVSVIFSQGYIFERDDLSSQYQRTCAYYLEMCKGATFRHEMISTHDAKSRSNTEIAWPDIKNTASSNQTSAFYTSEQKLTIDEFSSIFQLIPENLIVCSLSIDIERGYLYIVRYESGLELPIILRLGLDRNDGQSLSYKSAVDELENIMRESNHTMAQSESFKDKKSEWWNKRRSLDKRMGNLLNDIEKSWLGGFKGVLSNRIFDDETITEFRTELESIMNAALPVIKQTRCNIALNDEICALLLQGACGKSIEIAAVDDFLNFVLESNRISSNLDFVVDDINQKVATLITKFQAQRASHLQDDDEDTPHIILILDKHLQHFPWESLPILRGQSASRMTSISLLKARLLESGGVFPTVDVKALSYVLNPAGDLVNTQAEFKDTLQSWVGISGTAPSQEEYLKFLSSDVFLYFGHGGGEQYTRGQSIRSLDKCAVTLLFGCSSGRLADCGEFDPQGIALNFMIAGSPALVANLWDVTDRDIDRFGMALMNDCGILGDGRNDLAKATALARDACQLPFLVGAAPVLYGIPVYFR